MAIAVARLKPLLKRNYPDAKILSFSEIQKEFGLKDKECLNSKNANLITTHHFIKLPSGEYEILMVMTNSDNGNSIVETTYSNKEMFRTIENFKTQNAKCFN